MINKLRCSGKKYLEKSIYEKYLYFFKVISNSILKVRYYIVSERKILS